MGKIMTWLEDEAKGAKAVIGYAILAGLLAVSLFYTVEAILTNFHLVEYSKPSNPFAYTNILMWVDNFVFAPLLEEFMFRILPLTIIISFVSKSPRFILGSTIVLAILFGLIHPYSLLGRISVAISGLLFGIVFLKCGGLNKRFIKAASVSVMAHSFTNIFLTLYLWWSYMEFK